VGSVDNGIFIHAIAPRHGESMDLLCREAEQAERRILLGCGSEGRFMNRTEDDHESNQSE
jgi:hypothetical protein